MIDDENGAQPFSHIAQPQPSPEPIGKGKGGRKPTYANEEEAKICEKAKRILEQNNYDMNLIYNNDELKHICNNPKLKSSLKIFINNSKRSLSKSTIKKEGKENEK